MGKKRQERRRSLHELVSRYKLEPELCDIYVEGESDRAFIRLFLEEKGLNNFVVYDVDTVDIPVEKIQTLDLNLNSKRSFVITLANHLELELAALLDTLRVTCICDRDFDTLLKNEENWPLKILLFTDYSCLEMYWFHEKAIRKFLRVILYNGDMKPDRILNILSPVLIELFLIRAANQIFDFGIEVLKNFGDCCKLKGNAISFDAKKYITKYLDKGTKRAEEKNFIDKIDELRNYAKKNILDTRLKMHGHDFGELLCWYIKQYLAKNKRHLHDPKTIESLLFACGDDWELLESETLFKTLLSRLSSL